MITPSEQAPSEAYGGLLIPHDFQSKYPDFDWDMYPKGKLIHVMDTECHYFVPMNWPEVFLFTGEGFWYSNKRFPRAHPPLVRDWPSEEPAFDFDIKVPLCYFIGRDINVETETIMFQGKPYKPNYEARDRDLPHVLYPNGNIERLMWSEVPENVQLAKRPYKFVQAFRNKKGEEKIIETGLTKDGRTFVLVNEEIEAEMDEDKWWAENQNMIPLERRNGIILPCGVEQEQEIGNKGAGGSDESMSDEDMSVGEMEAKIEPTVKKYELVMIDEAVSMSRDGSRGSRVTGDV
ncbi:hypothetical protein BKA65DRAFT_497763, partial [Rhexocercosporidium sp. MPI-PUGE-AT-0058]